MVAMELTEILANLATDGGRELRRKFGPQALSIAEDISELTAERLREDSPYSMLWEEYQADPDATEAEMVGALEALLEADPGLARRLDAYLQQYDRVTIASRRRHRHRIGSGIAPRRMNVRQSQDDLLLNGNRMDRHGDFERGAYLYGDTIGTEEPRTSDIDQLERTETLDAAWDRTPIVGRPDIFQELLNKLDDDPLLDQQAKRQIQDDMEAIEQQVLRGRFAAEHILESRLRHIEQLAPELAGVLVAEIAELAEVIGGPIGEAYRRL